MTTEKSVLEKLKEAQKVIEIYGYGEGGSHCFFDPRDLNDARRKDLAYVLDYLPRLIAALELVEQKAQQSQRKNSGYWEGYHDGMVAWARKIRAVVNGETKGE